MKSPFLIAVSLLTFAVTTTSHAQGLRKIDTGDGKIRWVTQKEAFQIGKRAHEDTRGGFHRCGGYFDLTDIPVIKDRSPLPIVEWFALDLQNRAITQQAYLGKAIPMLDAAQLRTTVQKLSSYHDRFYKNQTGVDAANWIADQFKAMSKGRADVKVEIFQHARFKQPSVIATLTGKKTPEEVIVIGGHEDSVHQGIIGPKPRAEAPGADDNATGVATILETFRVLMQSQFQPDRTIQFMTYAGEEVGLLGSQEIANDYKNKSKNVVAVAQFDMTGFPGAGSKIVFMTDFTNPALTTFSQKLVDTYVKIAWSTDRCGYACSDHASWTKAGYPSVMPFEATMEKDNKNIHTDHDTIELLDFNHALAFAKLSLSFVAELSKDK